jgi:hypothetical protein
MPTVIVISDDEQDEVDSCPPSEPLISNPPSEIPGESRKFPSLEHRGEGELEDSGRQVQKNEGDYQTLDVEDVGAKDVSRAKKAKREERKAVSVPFPTRH